MGKIKFKDQSGNWQNLAPSQKEFDDNKNSVAEQLAENVQYIDTFKNLNSQIRFRGFTMGDIKKLLTTLYGGVCNVVFLGDSITAGADSIDPDNYNYANIFMEKLRAKFQNVTFNFSNYGIGGRTIQNAADPNYQSPSSFSKDIAPWATQQGKAWRDYVKDAKPDLLIIAFGMNSPESDPAYNYELLKQYIDTWDKKPSIAIITNYLPRLEWAGESGRQDRINHMRVARYWGLDRGYSILDIGDKYRSLVDGIDENGYVARKYTDADFTVNSDQRVSPFTVRNFLLEFNASITDTNAISIKFGKFSELKITKNSITLLYNGSNADNPITISLADGTYPIKIAHMDNNTMVIVGAVNATINTFGDFYDGALMITSILTNFNCVAYFNAETKQMLNEDDMLGNYVNGDYSTKSPYGGNGVNHPTTKNIEFVYKPEIDKFIEGIFSRQTPLHFDPPTRIISANLQTVSTVPEWGGGFSADGLELKYYLSDEAVDFTESIRLRQLSDGTYLTFKKLAQADVNQLHSGEFTIIRAYNNDTQGLSDFIILVNPTQDLEFYNVTISFSE